MLSASSACKWFNRRTGSVSAGCGNVAVSSDSSNEIPDAWFMPSLKKSRKKQKTHLPDHRRWVGCISV
jgi:hypothetical protein